ncbi:HlyC/CorC family transporter [Gordonia sp. X0973]|uniref:hemolysin family protein n=1 Tax=Gordonia sp. X0973 TaxID=2742602 RepID=UPI000F52A47F|nr:hemolysin family protein [Gordonia sp. X0973]QKT07384.1 HlyC/CorC family transporter [Gordonia sp. X0973]
MSDWVGLLLTVALLAANAFFVAAEFSLISARRDRLEALVDDGYARARTVIRASEQLTVMLAGAQLGITICSILLGRVGEPAIAHLLEKPLDWASVPHALLHPISFTVALTLVVILHILLGEMVPKNIALAGPERSAMLLVPIHLLFVRLTRPVLAGYNWLANLVLRAVGVTPRDELDSTVSQNELAVMIGDSRDEGLLDDEEHQRLTRALASVGRTIADVMIPLDRVRWVDAAPGQTGPTLAAVEEAVAATGYSRFPVRLPDGQASGYLHLKDVLGVIADDRRGPDTIISAEQIRPLPVLSAATMLDDAMTDMRRTSSHLGAVVDETGTTVGLVALADLVEDLLGTVRDATHQV